MKGIMESVLDDKENGGQKMQQYNLIKLKNKLQQCSICRTYIFF